MSPVPPHTIAIVLAGGRSRRMGGHVPAGGKAALPMDNTTMLARVCSILVAVVERVIVVAARAQPLPVLPAGVEITRDTADDHGPLAAIRDGLAYARASGRRPDTFVLCSCDVPDLTPAVVRFVIDTAQKSCASWVVPIVGGHPQVLVSAMSVALGERIASNAFGELSSLRDLLAMLQADDPGHVFYLPEVELAVVDQTLASFADIDTPEDLSRRCGAGGG